MKNSFLNNKNINGQINSNSIKVYFLKFNSQKSETEKDPVIYFSDQNKKSLKAQKNQNSILIAEDDDFNFFILERLLLPYHCKIIHAKNGREAVKAFASQQNIILILMDIQMPVMDGFTATREIRKINKQVPIIAQTAFAIDKVREMAISSGCNDFILKPLNSDTFIQTVEKYIA